MKIILIAGTRPNFMKIAPIIRAINAFNKTNPINPTNPTNSTNPINYTLVHTGQHYDYEMSKVFFEDLDLPDSDIYLGVGSGSHAEQTAKVMVEFEKVLIAEKPDIIVVVGDVNSTLACAVAASKIDYGEEGQKKQRSRSKKTDILHLTSDSCGRRPLIAHVEAGLRSFDRSMPEEINRILTDAISDYLFTPSRDANENLKREGISEDKIFFVGNVMVDSLLFSLEKAKKSSILKRLGLQKELPNNCQLTTDYCLLTLHRPGNIDQKDCFLSIIKALTEISKQIPVIFPVHPRTKKQIETLGLQRYFVNSSTQNSKLVTHKCGIHLVDPLGYLDFISLMMNSRFVITDSGGVQEETTVLGIPCLTLRDTTERPVTITEGTNRLVRIENLASEINEILTLHRSNSNSTRIGYDSKPKKLPEFWDGKASERIIKILRGYNET